MQTEPVSTGVLLQQLRWRYATKKFDPTRPIPEEAWSALEQALVLTPSSYGLQPWHFVVITDPAIRRELLPVSWNQAQVVDCSHLVVFAIRKHFDLRRVDEFVRHTASVRGVAPESLTSYQKYIVKDIIEGTRSLQVNHWAACQVYIALGNFMTSAALVGVDTCPMEGIESDRYDQILGLPTRGLATIVACAAGYRADGDKYAKLPKVRFPVDQIVTRL